jgi:hypothetical protein
MQLFGDLDKLSFVRVSLLNWIGRANRMDCKGKVSQVFEDNPQGSRLRGRQKIDGGTVYKRILINAKLKTKKRGKKNRADWERSIK